MGNTLETQLYEACSDGNLKNVKKCIETGANVHFGNNAALQLASGNGHLEVVKYLIEEAGANVHAVNDSCLQLASFNGHFGVIMYLLNVGINPLETDRQMKEYLPMSSRKRFLL